LGLDQAELASRVGVSRQWLIQVEKGKAGATIGLLLRLMNALDMNFMLNTGGLGDKPSVTPLDLPDPSAILERVRNGGAPT
jgi:HTH-type transcriptional regulator/antitoxin HipB